MGNKCGQYNNIKKINLLQNLLMFYLLIQDIEEI